MKTQHSLLVLIVSLAAFPATRGADAVGRVGNCSICPDPSRVTDADGNPVSSPGCVLGLYGGLTPDQHALAQIKGPINLLNGCWQTEIDAGDIGGLPQMREVYLQARVWGAAAGSWEEALGNCSIPRGVSAIVRVSLPSGQLPPPVPVTVCIPGFTVGPCVGCAYSVTVPPGGIYHPVGNACHDPVTVGELLPNPPLGTVILKHDNAAQQWQLNIAASPFPPYWWDASMVWEPGAGGYVMNPTSNPLTLTFQGPHTTPSLPLPWSIGCILICRQVGAPGGFEGLTGYPPASETTVYIFRGGVYVMFQYEEMSGWTPTEPDPVIGELVWVCHGGGAPARPPIHLYTLHVPSGVSLIANQCLNNNRVATLLPGMPAETRLWKFDNTTRQWSFNEFQPPWSNPAQTLAPGEGAYLINPASAFDVVIGGWANTPTLPLPFCGTAGSYLVSSQTPILASYEDIMGCAPPDGAELIRLKNSVYAFYFFDEGMGIWHPFDPQVDVGESVWIVIGGGAPPEIGCPLTIILNPSASTVTICSPCEGCHLQKSPRLLPPAWVDVPGGPCVTQPTDGTTPFVFYRVVCP